MGFPGNLMAGMFGFTTQPFFEIQDACNAKCHRSNFEAGDR